MEVYAIDIGGSSVKHGIIEVSDEQIIIKKKYDSVILETNLFSELKSKILDIIGLALLENKKLRLVGISTTGSVNTKNIVVSAGFFDGYENIDWEEIITKNFPDIEKVVTTNDGRASAWAEFISNNPEHKSHIHVVVGTGVGGGLVYNGELLLGDSGQAGYIGHMKVVDFETIICSCGKTGCVETLASARGLIFEMQKRMNTSEEIDYPSILKLADDDSSTAIEVLKNGGYWLGIGIGNCLNILNPTIVTIGGGVVSGAVNLKNPKLKDIYLDSVINGVKYSSHRRVFASCEIRLAKYGNDAGLVGAAHLCYKGKMGN